MTKNSRTRVLLVHPSPDLYGSDLQMVSAARGLSERQWSVSVLLPGPGPLLSRFDETDGVTVSTSSFRVLRKSLLSAAGLLGLLVDLPFALVRLTRIVRRSKPDVVYVNTVTIPWWIAAARFAGIPVIVHVREAEEGGPRVLRWALAAPLLLADRVVTNSAASREALLAVIPRLARRTSVIYNGIAGPDRPAGTGHSARDSAADGARPSADGSADTKRLVLVARLSERKGIDVAIDALGLLRSEGRDVQLEICGTVFEGYEWYEEQLRERADRDDVRGAVQFLGYVSPTWPLLNEADIVLVPSRTEPFGNTAVEGLLAARPVIASRVQGLREIISHGETGLLVQPGDAVELAAAIATLLDDPGLADTLAARGYEDAVARFSIDRYRDDIDALLRNTTGSSRRSTHVVDARVSNGERTR